jgi:hypothetical protein
MPVLMSTHCIVLVCIIAAANLSTAFTLIRFSLTYSAPGRDCGTRIDRCKTLTWCEVLRIICLHTAQMLTKHTQHIQPHRCMMCVISFSYIRRYVQAQRNYHSFTTERGRTRFPRRDSTHERTHSWNARMAMEHSRFAECHTVPQSCTHW